MTRTLLVFLFGGLALAAHDSPQTSRPKVTTLSQREIAEKLDGQKTSATMVEVRLEPGQASAPHRHPGPVFGYILEGEYSWAIDDQPARPLKAGDTFYEPGGCVHRVSKNPGSSRTRLLAVLLHPQDVKQISTPVLAVAEAVDKRGTAEPNTLSADEKSAGWRLLFDGKTTAGWRGYKSQTMPESWRVENGSLLSRREKGKSTGDIITLDQFDNFELVLDWKMTKGNNSGVFYRATEEYANVWDSGPEFQILDNTGHIDGLNPMASAGACYAVYPPAKDVTHPLGQWNQTRLVARGKHVEHWLNGEKLLEYDVGSKAWIAHVKTSKFFPTAYGQGKWGLSPRGHIGLQDYGGAIEFRNIKLRPVQVSAK
jgi:quercetin dioxygenase-like cupin family protein